MDHCTITQIARAAGVSVSTVSYALRGDAKISPVTTAHVRSVAGKLGYKANPAVSALMAHIRNGRRPRAGERIAFVWIEKRRDEVGTTFDRESVGGAAERAEGLGYTLEQFHLAEARMTEKRLGDILAARGIRGVIFSGCERRTDVRLQMEWGNHAGAIIGNASWEPELHRAGHHHFLNMQRVLLELARRHYARPAAWLEDSVNERAHRALEAAFLVHHPQRTLAPDFMRRFTELNRARTQEWLCRTQPDVLILTKARYIEPVRAMARQAGLQMDVVVLDLTGAGDDVSGIDPGARHVAANAVDLVVSQLRENVTGIPRFPKKLLFEGNWHDGKTVRPAA